VQNPKPKTTNERSSEQRRQALADYRPTPDLTALAESYGLDPEWELGKFRDTCLAEGKIPHDPASAYRKWLKRGRELNIGKPAAPPAANDAGNPDTELERRARKLLATSTPLRQRQPDDRERLRWLPQVAGLLAQGTSPARGEGASGAPMTVRRFVRSAITPPRGESRIVGRMLAVRMEANAAAEPVSSSTHMDMANRSIRLAKSDMPRPATSRRKSRVRRGSAAWLLCGWVVHSYAFVIVDSFLVIGHGHLYKPTVGLLW